MKKVQINYTDNNNVNTSIEFDNLDDAYSFTFCQLNDVKEIISVEVYGEGIYTKDEFQTAFSNEEF